MIFVDSSAYLSRYLAGDKHHASSLDFWKNLEAERQILATSNFVLDETFTLLGRKAEYPFAVIKAKTIYASHSLNILRPNEEDERQALEYFEKYADQKIAFTDCVSFVLMKKMRIGQVFTYDRHFEFAGFRVRPAREA